MKAPSQAKDDPGTLQYMAPEQVEARSGCPQDIFRVWRSGLREATAEKHSRARVQPASWLDSESNPPPISSLQPLMPPALIMLKTVLAKDRRALAIGQDICERSGGFRHGPQVGVTPGAVPEQKSNKHLMWRAQPSHCSCGDCCGDLSAPHARRGESKPLLYGCPPGKGSFSVETGASQRLSPRYKLVFAAMWFQQSQSWIARLDSDGPALPETKMQLIHFGHPIPVCRLSADAS